LSVEPFKAVDVRSVLTEYATGQALMPDYVNDAVLVAQGSITGTTTANSAIASVTLTPGQTIFILGWFVSNEGTSGAAHFDLYNVSGASRIAPLSYLPAPGEDRNVTSGTLKDPLYVITNTSTTANVLIAITIAAPASANTYTAHLRYTIIASNRPRP
jgi:hypothetical protein